MATVTLTSPQFGTQHKVQTHTISRRSAGGTLHQVSPWDSQNVYDFVLTRLTRTMIDAFLTFLCENGGGKITITTDEGNEWHGFVLPELISFQQTHREAECDGLFSLNFSFEESP